MKIISIAYSTVLLLLTLGFTTSTENSSQSEASNQNNMNLNSGIFESISKYKLKSKAKTHAKTQTKNKAASTNKAFNIPVETQPKPSLSINTLTDKHTDGGFLEKPALRHGPLLWDGWVKFYVYRTSDANSLLKGLKKYKYYTNNEYNEQQKQSMHLDLEERINDEYKYVHDPYSFWISVFPNNINFSTSRIVSNFLIIIFILYNIITIIYYHSIIILESRSNNLRNFNY